jgi:hypothetical protein
VAIYPPPICDHSLEQPDHIACLLFPIDDEAAEAVALERRQCLTPSAPMERSVRRAWRLGLTHLRNSTSEGWPRFKVVLDKRRWTKTGSPLPRPPRPPYRFAGRSAQWHTRRERKFSIQLGRGGSP